MTLQEALKITGIKEDEISRINKDGLMSVIQVTKAEYEKMPYDNKLKNILVAFETIYKETF